MSVVAGDRFDRERAVLICTAVRKGRTGQNPSHIVVGSDGQSVVITG